MSRYLVFSLLLLGGSACQTQPAEQTGVERPMPTCSYLVGCMEPATGKSSYFQPLVVNGFMLAVLSIPVINHVINSSEGSSPQGLAFFMLATLALPLVNFCFFIGTLFSRHRQSARQYGLLTLLWVGLVWWFISEALGAFTKMGR